MMKRQLSILVLALGLASTAHAQFGGIKLPGLGGGDSASASSGNIDGMVDDFNKESATINNVVSYATLQIVAALGDKEQIAAVRTVNENLKKTTDPKEKNSIQGTAIKEQSAVAQELLASDQAKAKIEKLTPEMQKKVGQSIFAVAVASLRLPALADKGQKIVSSAGANPLNIMKVVSIKDGISLIATALPKMTTIASTGLKLMRDVKVNPGNPAADSKLVANTDIVIPE